MIAVCVAPHVFGFDPLDCRQVITQGLQGPPSGQRSHLSRQATRIPDGGLLVACLIRTLYGTGNVRFREYISYLKVVCQGRVTALEFNIGIQVLYIIKIEYHRAVAGLKT